MSRAEFLVLLAQFIKEEAQADAASADANEPYRRKGDQLVDDALELIP